MQHILKLAKESPIFRRKVIAYLKQADEIGELNDYLFDESEELAFLKDELRRNPKKEDKIRKEISIKLVNLTSKMIRFERSRLSRTTRGETLLKNMKKVLGGYKFY